MVVENSNSSGWFGAGFGLGLLVGGFFIYVLVKSKETQPAVLQTSNPQQAPALPPINLYPTFSFKEPPPVPQIASLPVPLSPIAPAPVPQSQIAEQVTTFKNNEKWLIDRDEKGVLKSLQIIRDAKINGPD